MPSSLATEGNLQMCLSLTGQGEKDTALDVTVVHPLTPPRIASSAESPGSTLDLETAYRGKWSQTEEACAQEGIVFAPPPF